MGSLPGALFSQDAPDNIEATPIVDHADSLRILAAKTDGDYYHHYNIKVPKDQNITLVNDTIYLSDGGYVYLGDYISGEASDDQQITNFSYDPAGNQLSLSLENGGSIGISLASLEENLALNGHDLNIIGSSGSPIDLSPYLDNTDNQQLDSISYEDGILHIGLEDGGGLSVNIEEQEVDPIFSASPSAGITNADITNWNNDEVDDADADPTNELEPVTFTRIASNMVLVSGPNVNDGRGVVVRLSIDSTINAFGFNAGSGTDDQILSLVDGILSLENGGDPIDLTQVIAASEDKCVTVNVNTDSFVSPIDLPSDPEKRSVYINGQRCKEKTVLTRISHVSINSTNNNVTFYEALNNSSVTFCNN